jgi:hypothetical protein
VLVERAVGEHCSGRADRYFPVCFTAGPGLEGRLVPVRLVRLLPGGVGGELLSEPSATARAS